ncbi:MAG: ATP-binding cassette domain-containing protein [Acidobacteriaceae bacterium]|nr:ATP-binding cassette domain-containing protein [Acidobacteriaceae bacterium]MBV8570620.1 ATP-binding cassette domain-containing protein [Acidobacteriaceae bacterium]
MSQLRRLLRYARPYTAGLLASVFFMAVVGLSQGLLVRLIPLVFERVLDPSSPDAPAVLFSIPHTSIRIYLHQVFPASVHNIWTMVAFGIMACFLAKGVCDYFGNYLINWVGISAIMDLRQEVFDRILRQDAQFFEDETTGRIMSSIMNDIDRIQISVSTMLADWLRQIFTALFLLLAMISIDWRLSLISLLVFPVVAVLTGRLGYRIRHTTRYAQDMAAGLTQILQETITGHEVVKSFGAEDFESKRFRLAAQRLKSGNLKYVAHQAIASPIIEIFGALTIIFLLYLGREQVKSGIMTAGTFTGFVLALVMLYEPIKRLTNIHNVFQQGIGAALRVFGYLDTQPDVMDAPHAVKLTRFEKGIRLHNVSFSYPATPDRTVLDGINLDVKVGEVVALVGHSGAGKTTLANLVPRFYDVVSGSVQIDGRDIREIHLSSLRENISIVAQDTFLFNDTVFDNIAYGRPDASEEEVIAAARTALADEFIEKLPNGYHTLIGERGHKLSGGQRQRLAIARALLKDAPILILDEATSHLDTESERLVQQALTALMNKRTVIVIAHRLSTIRQASKIIVLENGKIVEAGTHEQLLSARGVYYRLHDLQHTSAGAIAG